MSTSKEYVKFILEQLSALEGISHRAMMGEYVLYYQGKVVGGLYDNRLLLKPTEAGRRLLPMGSYERPYDGAKEMLVVDPDDQELLLELLPAMLDELPFPKPKKKKIG